MGKLSDYADAVEPIDPRAGAELPDGVYKGLVDSIEFKDSKAGNLMCVFMLRVVDADSDYNGRMAFVHSVLFNGDEFLKDNAGRLLGFARKLGFESHIGEWEERHKEYEGRACKFKVETWPAKGDYPERHVTKITEKLDVEELAESTSSDVPF